MRVDEYFNQITPLGNNSGMVSTASIGLSTTPTSVDIRTLFGNIEGGHALTFKAEGPNVGLPTGQIFKAYFNLTPNPATIVHGFAGAVASGNTVGWPLADGQEIKARLISGRGVGTGLPVPSGGGYATMVAYRTINAFCSVGSGFLRVMRSTLNEMQDAGQFKPPIPSGVFPPGPSGWSGPTP